MKEKPIYEQLGYDPDPPFYAPTSKPIVTNYDRLISKTPEEIAKIVYSGCPPVDGCLDHDDYESPNCVGCWIDWLKQEAKE